jgi:hypothetical protein
MIVDDLNIEGIAIFPHEAYSVLVVDPYGVLTLSVVLERVQAIIGRHRQVLQFVGRIEHTELSPSDLDQGCRKSFGAIPAEDKLGSCVAEAADHIELSRMNVSFNDTFRKRCRDKG